MLGHDSNQMYDCTVSTEQGTPCRAQVLTTFEIDYN